ncbi:MAG: T9SS type A sorting domain-containing protein [Bacteroidota bacterium]
MRFIYLCLLLLFLANGLWAQLDIQPLQHNPVLSKWQSQKAAEQNVVFPKYAESQTVANNRELALDCSPPEDNIYSNNGTAYVSSGDSILICLANSSFPLISCLNCSTLAFGDVTLEDNCLTYRADDGIIAESEVVEFEQCTEDGNCAQVNVTVLIGRRGQKLPQSLKLLMGDEVFEVCAEGLNLPGDIDQSRFLACQNENIGRVVNGDTKDECFIYEANRFAEADTVCFEICDINCICDTLEVPIRIVGDTLSLPFMDDFSYSYERPLPDVDKWLDNRVYINDRYAFQPPSIGVATFDGLDEGGRAYGPDDGVADVLTSNYLNLEGGIAYLSFHLQPKGRSYQPEPNDSLVLQFKDLDGNWNTINRFNGLGPIPLSSSPDFRFWDFEIDEEIYHYSGFQFRFLSFGERYSTGDIWNLDYVRLTTDPIIDSTLNDAAFTMPPSRLLKNYHDMPWQHFEGFESQELSEVGLIDVYNHFSDVVKAEPSLLFIREITMNNVELNLGILLEDPQTQRNLEQGKHLSFANDFYNYGAIAGTFPGGKNLIFETEYQMEIEQENPGEFPQITENNVVKRKTYFLNFFSRDDGSAEAVGSLNDLGQELAIRFTPNVDDTLRAVQIMFPHFVNDNDALFNLKVWIGDLESDPVYARNFVRPYFADQSFDTLQGFTTYPLIDISSELVPIPLKAGVDFYIGFQQASSLSDKTYIGLDLDSPEAAEHQFINTGINWFPITSEAALMMRPVVGSETPPSTQSVSTQETTLAKRSVTVYPNPAGDQVYFALEEGLFDQYTLEIYGANGRLLDSGVLTSEKNLKALQNGVYFLRIVDIKNNYIQHHKLIIAK